MPLDIQASELQARLKDVLVELGDGGDGYIMVRGMIPPDCCRNARIGLHPAVSCGMGKLGELLMNLTYPGRTRGRTSDLLSRGPAFAEMLDDAALNEVIYGVCGEAAKCGSYEAHTKFPEADRSHDGLQYSLLQAEEMKFHIDLPYGDRGCSLKDPTTCRVLWMLDDLTELNGAPAVVPGSHMLRRTPSHFPSKLDEADISYAREKHVRITGSAGDCMICIAHLWHGVPSNRSEASTRSVIAKFIPFYFRPFTDIYFATPLLILIGLPGRARRLLTPRLMIANFWPTDSADPRSLKWRVQEVATSTTGIRTFMSTLLFLILLVLWQGVPIATVFTLCVGFPQGIYHAIRYRDQEYFVRTGAVGTAEYQEFLAAQANAPAASEAAIGGEGVTVTWATTADEEAPEAIEKREARDP